MHRTLLASVCLFALSLLPSPASAIEGVDTSAYGDLLETYVDEAGDVDYAGLKESEEAQQQLDAYLEDVAEADLEGQRDDAKLAFYLNAYNALVIDAILEAYPIEGPKAIDGFFKKKEHQVAGATMTLDHLEHGLVREEFEEPRIHFVLVCAAHSCPPLRQQPLDGETLDATLASATRSFVPEVTELKGEDRVITSRLLDWFADDFEQAAGSVRAYLAQYVGGDLEEALDREDVEIEFHEYDWSLNDQ